MRTGRSLALVIVLAGMLGAAATPAPQWSRPVYEVARARQPIRVDGRLDDAAWTAAAKTPRFVDTVSGASGNPATWAQVLYDDKYLYIAFRCEDTNLWATMRKRDEHLWTEEVVEVFLQADPTQKSYVELEVNPLGTLIDLFLLDIRKPLNYESWDSEKIQWAVSVDGTVDGEPGDRGWTCEIALPHEDAVPTPHPGPPKPGDRWRLNLYRIDSRPARALLAWSPTERPDFHTPSKFGEIVFTDKQVP